MATAEDDIQLAQARKFQKELNAGIVSLVLLSILGAAREPLYGYQIAKQLERDGDSTAIMKQGTLYPVLRALSAGGFLESQVEPSVSGPPRRYYRITDAGRQVLAQWKAAWVSTRDFVDSILEGSPS
ncbi:MAG TPA: PadR family transcriptional regulator [Gammaproteobacteria bacterium]|nr:PadR family transcriptional regulator [Gammaproteobacteria bacterium]